MYKVTYVYFCPLHSTTLSLIISLHQILFYTTFSTGGEHDVPFMNKLTNEKVSRRDFLKRSAAATAALASLSLIGESQNRIVKAEEEASPEHPEPVNNEAEGTPSKSSASARNV